MKNKKQEEINLGISNKLLAVIAIVLLAISTANTFILIMEREKQMQLREPKKVTGEAAQGTASIRILPRGCAINLGNKWNFISLCANATNTSIDKILENIDGTYEYILEWNESSQEFLVYSAKSETNPFNELNKNKSYFLYMNTGGEILSIDGNEYNDVNLSLIEEWNDPFYPYIFQGNVSLYLDDLGTDYEYMMKWGNANQTFYVYSRKSLTKPFNYIYLGEGQMLYITNPAGAYLYYNKTKIKNG